MSAREVLDEIQAMLDSHQWVDGQWRVHEAALDLASALRAVLDLHPAQDDHRSFLEGPYCAGDCTTDGNREQWPCPTVRAITEALDGTR